MPPENNVALPQPSTTDSPPVSVTLSFPVAPAVVQPGPAVGPVIPPLPTAAVATALPHIPDPSAVASPDVPDHHPFVAHDANDSPAGPSDSAVSSTPPPMAASSDTQSSSTTQSRDPNANILRTTERGLRLHQEAMAERTQMRPGSYRAIGRQPLLSMTQEQSSASRGPPSSSLDKRNKLLQSCQKTKFKAPSVSSSSHLLGSNRTVPDTPQAPSGTKQVKHRYDLRLLPQRQSPSGNMEALEFDGYPHFCFTNENILETQHSFAHCISADFAMQRGLAFAVACRYPALKSFRTQCQELPPGSLVTYFDPTRKRYIYNLITKSSFFHKPTYEALQLSLIALRRHMERHNIRTLSVPKLGCGLDNLHWPTVFSLIFQIFSGTNILLTLHQPQRRQWFS